MISVFVMKVKKVQAGKDQEKVQSEKDSYSKNRGGKKPIAMSVQYYQTNHRSLKYALGGTWVFL